MRTPWSRVESPTEKEKRELRDAFGRGGKLEELTHVYAAFGILLKEAEALDAEKKIEQIMEKVKGEYKDKLDAKVIQEIERSLLDKKNEAIRKLNEIKNGDIARWLIEVKRDNPKELFNTLKKNAEEVAEIMDSAKKVEKLISLNEARKKASDHIDLSLLGDIDALHRQIEPWNIRYNKYNSAWLDIELQFQGEINVHYQAASQKAEAEAVAAAERAAIEKAEAEKATAERIAREAEEKAAAEKAAAEKQAREEAKARIYEKVKDIPSKVALDELCRGWHKCQERKQAIEASATIKDLEEKLKSLLTDYSHLMTKSIEVLKEEKKTAKIFETSGLIENINIITLDDQFIADMKLFNESDVQDDACVATAKSILNGQYFARIQDLHHSRSLCEKLIIDATKKLDEKEEALKQEKEKLEKEREKKYIEDNLPETLDTKFMLTTTQCRLTKDKQSAYVKALQNWLEGPPAPGHKQREELANYLLHKQGGHLLAIKSRMFFTSCTNEAANMIKVQQLLSLDRKDTDHFDYYKHSGKDKSSKKLHRQEIAITPKPKK